MTRLPGLDPEVLAELRAREASTGDRTRSSAVTCECGHHVREHHGTTGLCMAQIGDDTCRCEQFVRAGGPLWSPPAIAERWPCTGCNKLVELTAEAVEMHAMLSRQLERRGERPLEKRIPCTNCKASEQGLVRDRRRPHEQQQIAGVDHERPSGMRAAGKGRR